MKIHKSQIIASTKIDLHGETRPREFFEKLIRSYPQRMPLHQQHDLGLDTVGYIENFHLTEDESDPEHFVVRADIYVTDDEVNPDLSGFSISFLEDICCNSRNPLHYIYLPYPLYNEQDLIDDIVGKIPDVLVGRFVKKSASAELVTSLIATGIVLLVSPEWQRQYEAHVRPAIVRLLGWLPKLKSRGASADMLQRVVGPNGEEIQFVFVPLRGEEERALDPDKIKDGVSIAFEFLSTDTRAREVGVRRIKLFYGESSDRFFLFHVEFLDGSEARPNKPMQPSADAPAD